MRLLQRGCVIISEVPIMAIRNSSLPHFARNLLIFAAKPRTQAAENGRNARQFANAAFWHGYIILDGLVPVLRRNHKRFAMPKSSSAPRVAGLLKGKLPRRSNE